MSESILIKRRQILAAAIAAPFAALALPAFASEPRKRDWRAVLLDRDRYLELERPQSGEKASFCYYRRGVGWDQRGYTIACTILRDVESKKVVQMSPKLLDLLFLQVAWLRMNDLPSKLIINSGYRTAAFNASLEGAAKDSMHVQARAADIKIPGVKTEQIAKLAKAIGVGGVGVYPSKGFIHVDIGKVRSWRVGQYTQHEESWLAAYDNQEIDQALQSIEEPDVGRIIYG